MKEVYRANTITGMLPSLHCVLGVELQSGTKVVDTLV